MAKKVIEKAVAKPFSAIVNLAVWVTGVLVSLSVGFGMADGVLGVRWLPELVTQVAGWIVIVLTIVSVIFAILNRL